MDFLNDVAGFLLTIGINFPLYMEGALVLLAIFAAIARVTPSPKDDGALKKIHKALNIIALNLKYLRRHDPNDIDKNSEEKNKHDRSDN